MNILTSLQSLFTLLKPNEDFAMMAGDVDLSAEILEVVVKYLTKENKDGAYSEAEVKVGACCLLIYLIRCLFT